MSDMGHGIKKMFQKVPLIILNKFDHDEPFLKKVSGLKTSIKW